MSSTVPRLTAQFTQLSLTDNWLVAFTRCSNHAAQDAKVGERALDAIQEKRRVQEVKIMHVFEQLFMQRTFEKTWVDHWKAQLDELDPKPLHDQINRQFLYIAVTNQHEKIVGLVQKLVAEKLELILLEKTYKKCVAALQQGVTQAGAINSDIRDVWLDLRSDELMKSLTSSGRFDRKVQSNDFWFEGVYYWTGYYPEAYAEEPKIKKLDTALNGLALEIKKHLGDVASLQETYADFKGKFHMLSEALQQENDALLTLPVDPKVDALRDKVAFIKEKFDRVKELLELIGSLESQQGKQFLAFLKQFTSFLAEESDDPFSWCEMAKLVSHVSRDKPPATDDFMAYTIALMQECVSFRAETILAITDDEQKACDAAIGNLKYQEKVTARVLVKKIIRMLRSPRAEKKAAPELELFLFALQKKFDLQELFKTYPILLELINIYGKRQIQTRFLENAQTVYSLIYEISSIEGYGLAAAHFFKLSSFVDEQREPLPILQYLHKKLMDIALTKGYFIIPEHKDVQGEYAALKPLEQYTDLGMASVGPNDHEELVFRAIVERTTASSIILQRLLNMDVDDQLKTLIYERVMDKIIRGKWQIALSDTDLTNDQVDWITHNEYLLFKEGPVKAFDPAISPPRMHFVMYHLVHVKELAVIDQLKNKMGEHAFDAWFHSISDFLRGAQGLR